MSMDIQILHHIYHFPGLDLPSIQDKSVCTRLADIFLSFAKHVIKTDKGELEPKSGYTTSAFEYTINAFESGKQEGNSVPRIEWFPAYGCAIIYHTARGQWSSKINIDVIGLDKHEQEVHFGKTSYQFSSTAKSFVCLHVGEINAENIGNFLTKFQKLFNAKIQKTGNERSAAGGRQGHQRTPAFIHAVLRQTLACPCEGKCSCKDFLPLGGLTDVGLHTGGEKRDTPYALVRSVFQWFLDDDFSNSTLFDIVLVHFNMYIANRVFSLMIDIDRFVNSEEANDAQLKLDGNINHFFFMIKTICISAARLSDRGYELKSIFEQMKKFQKKIQSIFIKWDEYKLAKNSLRPFNFTYQCPKFTLPDYVLPQKRRDFSKEALMKLIQENLGDKFLLASSRNDFQCIGTWGLDKNVANDSLQQFVTWAKQQKSKLQSSSTLFIFLREIEHVFWALSEVYLEVPLAMNELGDVMELVDCYRQGVELFSKSNHVSTKHILNSMRSVELLLVWLSYCITFHAVYQGYQDVMSPFGVALNFTDLKYLVLHDSLHIKTMKRVAIFLHRHKVDNMELFKMDEKQNWDSPTFEMGGKYALKYLYSIWEIEQQDAKHRADKHWAEVLRKQKLARQLRLDLDSLEEKLEKASADVASVRQKKRRRLSYSYDMDKEVEIAEENESRLTSKISALKRKITQAEKAPTPVIQPLPKNKMKAMKVIFFLYMPTEFKYLSRITLTAQQLLVPRPWLNTCGGLDGVDKVNVFEEIAVFHKIIAWKNHYDDNQNCTYHRPNESRTGQSHCVDLSMQSKVPETKHIGPNHIDEFKQSTQGVWYPDESNIRMFWKGGCHSWDRHTTGRAFDPFKIPSNFTASYLTEKLSSEFANMQWSLNVLADQKFPPTHGNKPYASQNLRPRWMSKEGFLDFTSMRRFPHISLRKFCVALKHNSLPLEHNAVHVLIRQTLFQIGDLSINENRVVEMDWRHDFNEVSKSCATLLNDLASTYSVKPHYYKACILLGELSNYFSCFQEDSTIQSFKDISRTLAKSAMSWAENSECETKKVLFYRTAVMCLAANGLIIKEDIAIILFCVVHSRNIFLRSDDKFQEIDLLKELCESKLSNCLDFYIEGITENPSFLSDTLKSMIRSSPCGLQWRKEESSHVSFSAMGSDGHIYSINTFNGVVLVDGLPPSQLPLTITNDELFTKTFGTNNFEVIFKDELGFETVNPVNGFYYRFHQVQKCVVIQESQYAGENRISQDVSDLWIDPLELVGFNSVTSSIPLKLRKAYSHWVSRKRSALIFRPFDFRQKDNIFYIHDSSDCKYIPRHIKRDSACWIETSKHPEIDRCLVVHDSPFLNILERFELRSMMLTYRMTSSDTFLIHFHRFGLTFSYDSECLEFNCHEISGYRLRMKQHLPGMLLHGLHQYLILDSFDQSSTKVIIPFGDITTSKTTGIQINLLNIKDSKIRQTDNHPEEEMNFFIYDVHKRFDTLNGTNLSSRIYLAGLLIANMFFVPDIEHGMTGEEKAIEILRQCWVNGPLTSEEKHCLDNVRRLSKCRSPTLFLLCIDIEKSSNKCNFLHGKSEVEIGFDRSSISDLSNECTAYQSGLDQLKSPRLLLQEGESHRCLGGSPSPSTKTSLRCLDHLANIRLCPIDRDIINTINKSLDNMWSISNISIKHKGFPLQSRNSTHLERTVYGELKKSWKLQCEEKELTTSLEDTSALLKIKESVIDSQEIIETYLKDILNNWSLIEKKHWHTQALKFFRLANILPTANRRDIAGLACKPEGATKFNPLLSSEAQEIVKKSTILWLELCVIEDKLNFLLSFKDTDLSQDGAFVNELVSKRRWNPHQHPYWLVFEVEQGIRIRPEQYVVAKHLIENDGKAVQLNMGLGKTRVILPMLILFWSHVKNNRRIPRLCILSTLLKEVCDYFQNVLSASILDRKLFKLPFQRDIELNPDKVSILQDMMKHCWQEHGFLVIAPEHRLSLYLKVKELHQDNKVQESKDINKILLEYPYCDIIDEVDEVLHHRFQLIYSIGEPEPLPQVEHRWKSIQALLKVMKSVEHFAGVTLVWNKLKPEAYPQISIDEDIDFGAFRLHLVHLLFDDPPFEIRWIKGHTKRDIITHVITHPNADPKALEKLSQEHLFDILSLRGLLAFDILLHCLKKRHRVDYGVNELGRKRLSVPFRGADTPSIRSEFSHPDCAITLTNLAYYDRGLTKSEIESTFFILLRKGRNSRCLIYNEWLELSKERMSEEIYRNPFTIEYWLNSCVFPIEVDQYPQRMVSNAWHLAHNERGHVVGFSGTNDNHWILPLQVKQHLPWNTTDEIWKNLLSTNGRMLHTLIEKTLSCEALSIGRAGEMIMNYVKLGWEEDRRIDALIDSGALLAGYSNLKVAQFIIQECLSKRQSQLRGVTFFDESRETNGSWMILDISGRCLPKDQSPLSEKETFAIFDEPRCRGVDLKLQHDAVAVLTLGESMRKDKFMQAAGRMRQLKSNQRIIVVGERKIFQDIERICVHAKKDNQCTNNSETISMCIDVSNVLTWIMHNTIESIWKGLGLWSEQGLFFATETHPQHAILDEAADLTAFYGKPLHKYPLLNQVTASKDFHCNRTGSGDVQMMDDIIDRVNDLGKGYTVMKTGVDEECERELEREVEEEEQEERESSSMTPRSEIDWNYSSIFNTDSTTKLPTKVYLLGTAIRTFMSCKNLGSIGWSNKVFCTENCIIPISIGTNGSLDNFLRIPDCFVRFPTGEILLLSEREANQILQLFWRRKKGPGSDGYHFGHCAFESDSCGVQHLRYSTGQKHASPIISDQDACSVNLFNGVCAYPGSQRQVLKGMLFRARETIITSDNIVNISNTSGDPLNLVTARAKNSDYDRSDLDQICVEIVSEYEMNEDF